MIRIVLIYVLPILLAIYALVDCIQTDEREIRGLPKFGWIILIVLVGIVGPIAWLVAGKNRAGRSRLPGLPRAGGRDRSSSESPRTLAPDDDPEFLGQLGSSSYDRALDEWEEELRRNKDRGETDDQPPDDGTSEDRPPS
jgi:hypothetical protein